MKETLFSR